MDILTVSAADFQRNIGKYQDVALSQPVAVTRNGRQSCVLISTGEYIKLKRREREVLALEDFTESDADVVRRAKPSEYAQAFDHEIQS